MTEDAQERIEWLEEELHSMGQETGLAPLDYRMLNINATLLLLVKHLMMQTRAQLTAGYPLDRRAHTDGG